MSNIGETILTYQMSNILVPLCYSKTLISTINTQKHRKRKEMTSLVGLWDFQLIFFRTLLSHFRPFSVILQEKHKL